MEVLEVEITADFPPAPVIGIQYILNNTSKVNFQDKFL